MSSQVNQITGACCAPEIKGNRYLIFPDGCQVGVKGLDKLFNEAYRKGREADRSVANWLVAGLSRDNYIPSSAWAEYEEVILKEYQKFLDGKDPI